MPLDPGARLGRYEIQALLGAGSMGEVYRAKDQRLGRDVAIKVLLAEFSCDPERLGRFEREARAASALNHPNIVSLFDLPPMVVPSPMLALEPAFAPAEPAVA